MFCVSCPENTPVAPVAPSIPVAPVAPNPPEVQVNTPVPSVVKTCELDPVSTGKVNV